MSLDDLSKEDAMDLLQQTRYELERCKKSLAFKESLLVDLEFEVSDLARENQQLRSDVKCHRHQEMRRKSLELGNSIYEDTPRTQPQSWNPDTPQNLEGSNRLPDRAKSPATCKKCRLSDIERSDLTSVIEELHDEKERLTKLNQRLLRTLDSKSAQLEEISADASKEKALRRTLEASIEFLTVEKELVERDLRDFRESSLPFARLSDVTNRGMSLGSSLGEELGLGNGKSISGERKFSLPANWNLDDIEHDGISSFDNLDDLGARKSFPEASKPSGINRIPLHDIDEENHEPKKIGAKRERSNQDEVENDCEDQLENLPTESQTPVTCLGWRSLVCMPYRRLLKRKRH
ncbi:uncharacterized protein LOC100908766 [Galendromus occidentalis]|uniref:Uncharacterized protein LOC100908766 n=1 Tax=Galendromus occidentalis TaxID=34638 RepID=A0AAJ6QN85_9ACAR|nr:uncharacterized protein LOC100908766 [Galendromus occidentalis]